MGKTTEPDIESELDAAAAEVATTDEATDQATDALRFQPAAQPTEWEPVEPSADAVLACKHLVVAPALGKLGELAGGIEYEPELVDGTARAVAAVGEKYGTNPPAWFQRWYEEIQLARMLATVGAFTFAEIARQEREAEKTAADADEPHPDAAE